VEITVTNRQAKVDWDSELSNLVVKALQKAAEIHDIPDRAEVSLVLVDDEEIRLFNKEYRGVDRPTDVLSFALDEKGPDEPDYPTPSEMEALLGDIIISLETAQRQGEEFGHGLARETAYLAVHGMLHLLGYDHDGEDETKRMRAMEERVLAEIGLGRP